MKKNTSTKNKKIKKKQRKIYKLTIFCIFLDIFVVTCFFLAYGPYDKLRNLYITTAMKTMNHQYFAKIFYSDKTIEKVMNSNYLIKINDKVNLDNIVINTKDTGHYKNKYEEQILKRDNKNDTYKLINTKVGSANAYLVAIYEPKKVRLVSKETLGTEKGEQLKSICKRYGAEVCINGGGFVDYGYGSGIPLGYVIEDGEITWSDGDSSTTTGEIIGLTKEGKLMLLDGTGEEALKAGIIHGLQFGPFLIVNGKPIEIVGDPWGKAPRVSIAQRKDGIILFLVIDGENYISGAGLQDVVDTLVQYGAYNAANLDGGTSSSLVINGELVNNPPKAKSYGGRFVVTGWGLVP